MLHDSCNLSRCATAVNSNNGYHGIMLLLLYYIWVGKVYYVQNGGMPMYYFKHTHSLKMVSTPFSAQVWQLEDS